MSSPISSDTGTAVMNHRTNHCNSCNTDLTTANSLLCPHCISSNPDPNSSPIQSFINSFTPSTTTTTTANDSSNTSSVGRLRLLSNLRNFSPSYNPNFSQTPRHSPTSKSAIESIPTITVTDSFLEIDPNALCAVCKDQFVVNDETKQLPCKHIYHPDCILPWLSKRNSCPVCRFQMPKEPARGCSKIPRRSRSRVLGFGNLMEDEAMLGIGFSNSHEQHMQSENRIAQTVHVDMPPDSEVENGVVNVSWPGWSSGSNGSLSASDMLPDSE